MKHTQGKWEVGKHGRHDNGISFIRVGVNIIAKMLSPLEITDTEQQANAQRICLCVNSHDALLEMLTNLTNCLSADDNDYPDLGYYRQTMNKVKEAREVIKQAE